MSILKKLREARRLSTQELAEKLGVDASEIMKWESDSEIAYSAGLSSFSHYLGLSTDDLINYTPNESPKLSTNTYYVFTDRTVEDGWWGHFGVRPFGHKYSKWFPITVSTANYISKALANIESTDEWLNIETLNNRILIIRPAKVNKLWLLDEAQDQPPNDWNIPLDTYYGNSGEFYKGLQNYYYDEAECGNEFIVSDYVMKDVEQFTDTHDLSHEQVGAIINETHFFSSDGAESSIAVDGERLAEIINCIEYESIPVILNVSYDDYYLYLPTDNICLIDMPKRLADVANRQLISDMKEINNED